MDARLLSTATACKTALDALGCHAVERLTGQMEVRALEGGALWVPGGVVATLPATDLPAWLAARVQPCACADCGGAGRDEDHVVCAACHGAGDALEPVDAPDMDSAAMDAGDARADASRDAEGA